MLYYLLAAKTRQLAPNDTPAKSSANDSVSKEPDVKTDDKKGEVKEGNEGNYQELSNFAKEVISYLRE